MSGPLQEDVNITPTNLDSWQSKLEQHFSGLAVSRQDKNMPVFALEHGLTQEEMERIFRQLKIRLRFPEPNLRQHWLLWVIYAAEQGYNYDGDEYWITFKKRTPHWHDVDRYSIRRWFHKFHETYGGVEPTGAWAEKFSIIAWPITHAILPKDMQLQMARTLYELKYQLARHTFHSPVETGRLLASSAGHTTLRFDNFLQQHELVGRIVAALIYNDPSVAGHYIHEPTLARIVCDLEKMQDAREWLQKTKRVVEITRLRSLGKRTPLSGEEGDEHEEQETDEEKYDIRPKLALWHVGDGAWKAVIYMPGFASLVKQSPNLQTFFKGTRCNIAGTDGKLPSGWLLQRECRKTLKSWPDINRPVLSFERTDPQVEQLIQSACRITSGPIWLFHIGADGVAREITSRLVRAGEKYVLLHTSALDSPMLMSCTLQCEGIQAKLLTIPATLKNGDINHLKHLGLSVARTILLWPAGIPARAWDEVYRREWRGEWLSTEPATFGLTHDTTVDAYAVQLDGHRPVRIEATGVGNPVFFQVPALPVGRHELTVTALERSSVASGVEKVLAHGMISLLVRDPEPWTPGLSGHAGLTVFIDPIDPSLDAFLEGDADIHIYGPEDRQVTCHIALMRTSGEELVRKEIGKFSIPVSPAMLSQKIKRFADQENDSTISLRDSCGMFIVDAEELGEFNVRLYRDALPLRWRMVTHQHKTILRLTDDTGNDTAALKVQFYSFSQPTNPVNIATDGCLEGTEPIPPGGLYIAERDSHRQLLVVSPPSMENSLHDLVISPVPNSLPNDITSVPNLLSLIDSWNSASIAGSSLAVHRRRHTVEALTQQIYLIICGKRWATAEQVFHDSEDTPVSRKKLQSNIDRRFGGFSSVLGRDGIEMLTGDYALCLQLFYEISLRYGVCSDKGVCDFAIRLACLSSRFRRPLGENILENIKEENILDNIEEIVEYPALLCGARLMVVFAQRSQQQVDNKYEYR